MIKCPNCGGVLKFNVFDQKVKCDHCGSVFEPTDTIDKTKKAGESESIEGKVYSCSQCGASLMSFDETAITFCSYCGSQAMIESKMILENKPDYIIPFAKSKEECIAKFKSKVNKSLFVPNYLKEDLVLDKFRGIYMPYCIYNLKYKGPTNAKGSIYSHRSGDYVYYNDYTVNFDVDASYEGFSYDLVSKLYDRYTEAIPFIENKALPYNPNYMLGFYADTKDVGGDVNLSKSINMANDDYQKKVLALKEVRNAGVKSVALKFDVEQKTGMFPLYFLAVRTKDEKRINYAVVNGQTGDLVTELPVSYPKYVIGSLILSLIIFLIINAFLVLTPHEVSYITIVIAVIGIIISSVQGHSLKMRETHGDDLGFKNKEEKIEKRHYTSILGILLQVTATIVPIIVIVLNPVGDIYYYEASIISLILLLVTFYNIIKKHNELVSNKLPQLEKRGGDESA